jgi:hypothetical protein
MEDADDDRDRCQTRETNDPSSAERSLAGASRVLCGHWTTVRHLRPLPWQWQQVDWLRVFEMRNPFLSGRDEPAFDSPRASIVLIRAIGGRRFRYRLITTGDITT